MATNPDKTAKVVKLSDAQLTTIVGGGSISSGSDTYTADENTLYLVKSNANISKYTLSVGNWSSNQYTLSVTGKTSYNNAKVYKDTDLATLQATLDNSNAIDNANIYAMVDNGTTITLVCETTPTTDLYILVEVCD